MIKINIIIIIIINSLVRGIDTERERENEEFFG